MSDLAIIKAFEEASLKLGFSFKPQFILTTPDGTAIRSLGLVQYFGRPNGTLIFSLTNDCPNAEEMASLGYYTSVVASAYQQFDEELFRETLDDWGFFGPTGLQPAWYTGRPWS